MKVFSSGLLKDIESVRFLLNEGHVKVTSMYKIGKL
jgi:glycerol-3-phosphate responsive antiterminator